MLRFTDELIARVDRAGATGPKLLRADSGFWAKKTFDRLDAAGWQFSIGVRLQAHVRAAIEQIDETAWMTLAGLPADLDRADRRDHARRPPAGRSPRPHPRQPGRAAPDLGALSRSPPTAPTTLRTVEAEHRQHAVVELAIRDLKDQALAHFPSGKFTANAAWTVIAALAHNLLRWTSVLGLPGHTIRAARTLDAAGCSRCPAASPGPPGAGRCTCPPAGPGATPSPKRSPASARSPPPPDYHSTQRQPATPATLPAARTCASAAPGRPLPPRHSASSDPPARTTPQPPPPFTI